MCKSTWVCFRCRRAVRRFSWRHITYLRPWLIGSIDVGNVRCPGCKEPCRFLGPTIEIPPKQESKKWKRLQAFVEGFCIEAASCRFKKAVRARHDLEQRIRDLMARDSNEGREELIAELKEQLGTGN